MPISVDYWIIEKLTLPCNDSIFAKRAIADCRWKRGAHWQRVNAIVATLWIDCTHLRCPNEFPAESRHVGAALSALRRLRGSSTLIPDTGTVDIKFNARQTVPHAGTEQVAQTSPSSLFPLQDSRFTVSFYCTHADKIQSGNTPPDKLYRGNARETIAKRFRSKSAACRVSSTFCLRHTSWL